MRLKSLALSFLMLTTLGDLARSNESNTPLSPQLTLTKINELQQKLKFSRPSSAVEPQKKLDSVSLSQRLANLQRLQEMRSQDSVPSDQINPSVLQSLSVQPEGVVIDTSGKEPKILVNSEQELGFVHITLNGILLDPDLNLSQDTNKTNSAIQSIRVNQISTQPAIAEIIIQTPQKNWQLIPHKGSFLLTQIKNDKLGNQELSASASEITLNSNTELTEENNSTSSSQLSVAIESFIQNYYKNWQLIPHEGSFILAQVKNNKTGISETETTLIPNSSSQVSAAIELFVEKHYKNWQLIPHEGSFILSQRKFPTNVDIQSSIIESETPQTENADGGETNSNVELHPEEKLTSANNQNTDSTKTENLLVQLENSQNQDSDNTLPIPNNSDDEITPELDSEKSVTLTPLQLPPTQLINLETANVLPQGSILTTYGVHLFPKGQYGAGTGLQTYNISIDGGVTDNFQLGLDWVLFDDTLGEKINGNVPYLNVMSFAPKFKYQFLKESNFSLALSGSLEIGKFTGSYGLYTPNNLQQTSSVLIGSLQLPFTYNVTSNFQWHLVPGGFFFPNTINNGGDFYGSFFNIGTGFNYRPLDRLTLFADVNLPVVAGGNAVNNQGQTFRKPVWSAGLTYLQSPTVGIDLYATNALGATPATQVLAFIPNGNQVSAGVNVRYTPDFGQGYPSSFRQGPLVPLSVRDKQLLFNGITLTSAGTLNQGMFSLQGGVGPNVNFQVAYGMSDDAQLEFIGQQLGNSNLPTGNAFKLGVGTKLRLLDQVQGDLFSLSVRGAFEQASSEADGEGLVSAELAFLYQINSQIALMFNPKAGFFGSTSLVGMGLGLNYNVLEGLQFIGEVTPMVTGEKTVWAGAIRYLHPEWNGGLDLYATNAVGTHGVGSLIGNSNNNISLGFNLLWLFNR